MASQSEEMVSDNSFIADLVREVRNCDQGNYSEVADASIHRLLESNDFDVSCTSAAVLEQVELESSYGAIETSDVVEEISLSRRFRFLGLNNSQRPVIVLDWMWGKFLDVDGGLDTTLKAYCKFMRRACAQVEAELPCDVKPEFLCINIGGPPPHSFITELARFRRVDFGANISGVILYPMDPSSAKGQMTANFMQRNTDPTVCSFNLVATANELVENADGNDGFIPDDVLYCTGPSELEKPLVAQKRLDLLIAPPLNPIDGSLPSDVVVKNTFLDDKPREQRTRCKSFSVERSDRKGSIEDVATQLLRVAGDLKSNASESTRGDAESSRGDPDSDVSAGVTPVSASPVMPATLEYQFTAEPVVSVADLSFQPDMFFAKCNVLTSPAQSSYVVAPRIIQFQEPAIAASSLLQQSWQPDIGTTWVYEQQPSGQSSLTSPSKPSRKNHSGAQRRKIKKAASRTLGWHESEL